MPQHIAIIMDGNGRWAERRGLKRSAGHEAGSKQISLIADAAVKAGVKILTLYAFSTENWKRASSEIDFLFNLIKRYSDEKLPEMKKNGIKLQTIGRIKELPLLVRKSIEKTQKETAENDKLILNIALNYGGRAEIVDAVNKIIENKDNIKGKIDEKEFQKYLYDPNLPDPELLIRTASEFRLSNFLLWQISYSEIYIRDKFWPDFDEIELQKAIDNFRKRKRRFGAY